MTSLPARLAALLNKVVATARGVAAKFTARRRVPETAAEMLSGTGVTGPAISAANGKGADELRACANELRACANSPDQPEAAPAPSSGPVEREKLIRRRWNETGIKMWSSDLHGSGKAALKIQGQAELLPIAPGESSRAYDKLEFKLIGESIVCEGVLVDPPKARHQVEHRTGS